LNAFLRGLQVSALCDEQPFQQLDGDTLIQLYDDTVTALLNEQIPVRRVFYRGRASSLRFDDERRTAKASAAAVGESCSSRWSSLRGWLHSTPERS